MDKPKLIDLVRETPALWDHKDRQYHFRDLKAKLWREIGSKLDVTGECAKKTWENMRDLFRRELKVRLTTDDYVPKWIHYQSMLFLKDVILSKQPQINSQEYTEFQCTSKMVDSEEHLKSFKMTDVEEHMKSQVPLVGVSENLEYISDTNNDFSPCVSDNDDVPSYLLEPSCIIENSANVLNKIKQRNLFSKKRHSLDPNTYKRQKKHMHEQHSKVKDNPDDDYHFMMSILPYLKRLQDAQKLRVRMDIMGIVIKELDSKIINPELSTNTVSSNQQPFSDAKLRNRHKNMSSVCYMRYSPISSGCASAGSCSPEHVSKSLTTPPPPDLQASSPVNHQMSPNACST